MLCTGGFVFQNCCDKCSQLSGTSDVTILGPEYYKFNFMTIYKLWKLYNPIQYKNL